MAHQEQVAAIARAAGAELARAPVPKEVLGLEFGDAGEVFLVLADGERFQVGTAALVHVLSLYAPHLAHFGGFPPKGVPLVRRRVDRRRYGTGIIFTEAGR